MNDLNHATEYNRMMETAKKRASELRSDAINDFWSGAENVTLQAFRSARRFAASLARHSRSRNQVEA